jgi:hypothetical protein
MTCGSSEPLVTVGDRCCPCGTVPTRTQRGPSVKIHRRCLPHGVAARWSAGLRAGGALSTMGTVSSVLGMLRSPGWR